MNIGLYSPKFDEIVVFELFGTALGMGCSDDFVVEMQKAMEGGVGFIFIADWIYIGHM